MSWTEMGWQERADTGRAEGGQHLPRITHTANCPLCDSRMVGGKLGGYWRCTPCGLVWPVES